MKIKSQMLFDYEDSPEYDQYHEKSNLFDICTSELSSPDLPCHKQQGNSPSIINPFEFNDQGLNDEPIYSSVYNDFKSSFCFSTKAEKKLEAPENQVFLSDIQANFNQFFFCDQGNYHEDISQQNERPIPHAGSIYDSFSDNELRSVLSTESNSNINFSKKDRPHRSHGVKKIQEKEIHSDFIEIANHLTKNQVPLSQTTFFKISRMGIVQDMSKLQILQETQQLPIENNSESIFQVDNDINFSKTETSVNIPDLTNSNSLSSTMRSEEKSSKKQGCKCKKSNCMKSYCECFVRGDICSEDCKCEGCANNTCHLDRQSQVNVSLLSKDKRGSRNSVLIKKEDKSDLKHVHCNCSKSGCSKNYCECFRVGQKCSSACGCTECFNSPRKSDDEDSGEDCPVLKEFHRIKKIKKIFVSNIMERVKFLSFIKESNRNNIFPGCEI